MKKSCFVARTLGIYSFNDGRFAELWYSEHAGLNTESRRVNSEEDVNMCSAKKQ
jgi:hypothetical protein